MTNRSSIKTRILAAIFLILTGCIAAVALGELAVRVYYGDKYSKRPPFYGPHESLGWAPTPNLNHRFYGGDFTTHIQTDKNGYRLGSLGEVDFLDDLIVLCGDSYVFGWGVSTDETFASYLDEAVHEYTDGRMRVVNLGVGGYGTWQHFSRLVDFVAAYSHANVAAMIVVHCQNDPIDNVKTIGYTQGYWKAEAVPNEKSRWHMVNFVHDARDRIKHAKSIKKVEKTINDTTAVNASDRAEAKRLANVEKVREAKREQELQDELWSYKKTSTFEVPSVLYFGEDSVNIEGLDYKDSSPTQLTKRQSMSRIQRQLYYHANISINQLARLLDCGVLHTCVYTSDDWFVNEVDSLLALSTSTGIVRLGRVPPAESFEGEYINEHSGKHYNPGFNRFWAGKMFDILRDSGVLERSGIPKPDSDQ